MTLQSSVALIRGNGWRRVKDNRNAARRSCGPEIGSRSCGKEHVRAAAT